MYCQRSLKSPTLYQPCDYAQGLIHENASCLAVKTYLIMCHLPFTVKFRSNAEFMVSQGRLSKLPLLYTGSEVFAEFLPIVAHIAEAMDSRVEELEDELWAFMTWVENTFTMAELYISFMDKSVYAKVTVPRIKSAFPWPLTIFRVHAKRRQCLRLLRTYQWHDLSNEDVIEKLERCCEALAQKLRESELPYFGGEQPCELDALVFGHIFTILTTNLSNPMLAETLVKFKNLTEFCCFIEEKYFKAKKMANGAEQ